jgi:hypothetical protein
MRLLHRHEEDVHDVRDPDAPETTRVSPTADEHAPRRSFFRRTARDDRAVEARDAAALEHERAELERERARDQRPAEVVDKWKRWDFFGFLTAAYGVALAVMGTIALVRTGVDDSWYEPVAEVVGVRQSPLMGAIELGAGVVLVLALLVGLRMLAALVAIAGGVVAAAVAVEPSQVNPELAIQRGWAIALAATSLALGLSLIATRERRRVRRGVRDPLAA